MIVIPSCSQSISHTCFQRYLFSSQFPALIRIKFTFRDIQIPASLIQGIQTGAMTSQVSQVHQQEWIGSDGHHPTEKALAVRPYVQNVRRLTAEDVFGMVEGRPAR